MTLFDKQQSAPETPGDGKFKEALVGEGKKFKDDEALARGKWESDQYIARLEAEKDELRNELKTRLSVEDAIAEIKRNAQAPSSPEPQAPGQARQPETTTKSLTPEELDAFLESKLNSRQQVEAAQRNLDYAKRELLKAWGPSAQSQLRDKARELEVSESLLDDMAAKTPKAFLKLVGADIPQRHVDGAPPRSSSTPPSGSNTKNWAYYKQMLQSDPVKYHSAATQQEIYKAAFDQGENFYK